KTDPASNIRSTNQFRKPFSSTLSKFTADSLRSNPLKLCLHQQKRFIPTALPDNYRDHLDMQHALNGDQGNLDTLRPRRGEAAILILCTDQVKNNSLDFSESSRASILASYTAAT